ncbi:MAG: hypothetical protein ACRCX2_38970 [Paraclostridium sp.]
MNNTKEIEVKDTVIEDVTTTVTEVNNVENTNDTTVGLVHDSKVKEYVVRESVLNSYGVPISRSDRVIYAVTVGEVADTIIEFGRGDSDNDGSADLTTDEVIDTLEGTSYLDELEDNIIKRYDQDIFADLFEMAADIYKDVYGKKIGE